VYFSQYFIRVGTQLSGVSLVH